MGPEKLESLGFTYTEAKIYLILLQKGQLQAGGISKFTQINRRTTYDTIARLQEKGYITYTIGANRKIFQAVDPEIIIKKIDEMKTEAQEMLPELKILHKDTTEDQETVTYMGRKGVRAILQQLLEFKEYVGFGSNEKFPEVMKHDFELFQKEKLKRKIKSRTLMSGEMKNKDVLKTANTVYRFLPSSPSQPTSTFVYGNTVAIIIWTEIPVGLVIKNKTLAQTYLQYFDTLWDNAKK